jgi:hypothetical protein
MFAVLAQKVLVKQLVLHGRAATKQTRVKCHDSDFL